jgi:hypothetical protein
MATLKITSVCINADNDTWITLNGMLYATSNIKNPNAVWSQVALPPGVSSILQVSCGTRYSDRIAIIDQGNSVWYGTGEILTAPTWVKTPDGGVTNINLQSNGALFGIGMDGNLYRNKNLTKAGGWDFLPKPKEGIPPGAPVQMNDYNKRSTREHSLPQRKINTIDTPKKEENEKVSKNIESNKIRET